MKQCEKQSVAKTKAVNGVFGVSSEFELDICDRRCLPLTDRDQPYFHSFKVILFYRPSDTAATLFFFSSKGFLYPNFVGQQQNYIILLQI